MSSCFGPRMTPSRGTSQPRCGVELAWNNSGPPSVNHINEPTDRQEPAETTWLRTEGENDEVEIPQGCIGYVQRTGGQPTSHTLRPHSPRRDLPHVPTCRPTTIANAVGRGRDSPGDVGNTIAAGATRAAGARRMNRRRKRAASWRRPYATRWHPGSGSVPPTLDGFSLPGTHAHGQPDVGHRTFRYAAPFADL